MLPNQILSNDICHSEVRCIIYHKSIYYHCNRLALFDLQNTNCGYISILVYVGSPFSVSSWRLLIHFDTLFNSTCKIMAIYNMQLF